MRFSSAILILAMTGCSLTGGGNACQPPVEDCNSQQCTDQGSCDSGWSSLMCRHGWCLPGRHTQYKRLEDNIVTRMEARHLAQANLREFDTNDCVTCDYRLGYEQAFVDVSLGSCGEVPALPPANYWKNCARSPEGHQKAQQWFSGYAAGAARAITVYEPYNVVAHSQFDGDQWIQ